MKNYNATNKEILERFKGAPFLYSGIILCVSYFLFRGNTAPADWGAIFIVLGGVILVIFEAINQFFNYLAKKDPSRSTLFIRLKRILIIGIVAWISLIFIRDNF